MDIARPIFSPAFANTPARDRMVSAMMLVLWAAVTLWHQWGEWAEDLSAVYIAGWLWHTGQGTLIYDAPPAFFGGISDSWRPAMAAMGIADQNSFAYVYPPLWAVLVAPVTALMSAQGFFNAVAVVQIPLLAASVWLAGRIFKPDWMQWWLWSFIGLFTLNLSIQAHLAVWHNQPTITVGFLVLLAFERLGAGRPTAAGAALALAAAIKLTPAAYVLLFLIGRQWHAAAAFAVTGAALGLASIALAGWPAHQAFLDSLAHVKGVSFLIAINISLLPAILAAGSALGLLPPVDPTATQHVFTSVPGWISPVITLAALTLIAAFARRLAPLDGPVRQAAGLLALSIILALFGPLGWQHYYVVPMLLLPGILGLLPRGAAIAVLALVGIPSLSLVFAEIGVLPWPVATYTWIMCAIWLAVLAVIAVAIRRLRRPPARQPAPDT